MRFFCRIFLLIVFILSAGEVLLAQQEREAVEDANIFSKFGQISKEELSMKADHNYPFEFLLKETSVRFQDGSGGLHAIIDHLVRIKIYSDDPLEITEASLVGIPFYNTDNLEVITQLEGITHQPDGSRVSLDPAQSTRSDLNSRYQIVEFEMPEAGAGSVLEYKYRVVRRYIEELPDFYFTRRVPTKKAAIVLQNEPFLRYKTVSQNINFRVDYNEVRIDTSSVPRIFTFTRPEPISIERWYASDIPAVEEKPYLSSIEDIHGKMKFQINEFGLPRQRLTNTWEYIAAQIRRTYNPFQPIKTYSEFGEIGRDIAESFDNLTEIQDSVFQYVNQSVQYSGLHSVFPTNSLVNVLEGEPANQAEINTVLMAILRGAGIEVYPIYISGRDYGRINTDFSSLFQFNSMLLYSEIEEEKYFMDASFPQSYPNLIPVESYTDQGLVLEEGDFYWADISPKKSVFDLNIIVDADLSAEGHLTGTLTANVLGYPARQIMQDIDRGESLNNIVKSTFFDVYQNATVSSSSIKSDNTVNGEIEISGEFKIENYAASFREGLELRPMIVGYLFENPFEESDRNVPVTLDAPEKLTVEYNILLPAGYEVEGVGEARSNELSGAELTEQYLALGRNLNYSFSVDISNKKFPATSYRDLRQLYQRWVELSNNAWYIKN